MLILNFVITFFIFFSSLSFADNIYTDQFTDFETAPTMPEKQVLENELLGFEGNGSLELRSSLPGDPLKYKIKRSLRLLNNEQLVKFNITTERLKSLYGKADINSYYIFANFIHGMISEHESQFWIAIIPKFTKITNIYAQLEWFVQGAGAHMQYRMKISDPITLIPQNNKMPLKDWHQNPIQIPGDFVYTLLALRTQNGPESWDPIRGVTGVYANAYSLQSTQHTAEDQTQSNFVEQVELIHPGDEAASEILKFAILNSDAHKEQDIYNSVFNSCVTAAMEALYANGGGYPVNKDLFNPYRVWQHLAELGIIKNDKIPSLNEEFSSKITRADMNPEIAAKLKPLLPLIRSDGFDLIVRDITSYIVSYNWSYSEISILFKAFQHIPKDANLLEVQWALNDYLKNSNLSEERISQIKILAIDVFNYLVDHQFNYDPIIAQAILGLTQQD
ncbi:MAG: hypothetical protein H6625_01950 [Bdellovibrionaceae bacterium]|nr:hypothetical protein [Pseudobdellovibrionaceae bacterium]